MMVIKSEIKWWMVEEFSAPVTVVVAVVYVDGGVGIVVDHKWVVAAVVFVVVPVGVAQ
jgi:hypothetical protein